MLKDLKKNIAISIKAKEEFVCKSVFSKLSLSINTELIIIPEIAYKKDIKVEVANTLMSQFVIKTSRLNKINF